jgi:hypothetical protein
MMEPEAYKVGKSIADQVPAELRGDTVNSVAVVSLAISLKRIADALQGNEKNLYDLVRDISRRAGG